MQLHPRHLRRLGLRPRPLSWEAGAGASQAQRLRDLAALAEKAAQECGGASMLGMLRQWHAALGPDGLTVIMAGRIALAVPLLFCEVAHAPVGDGSAHSVLALAPARAPADGADARTPAGAGSTVWLLVSEGGQAALRQHLRDLSAQGAIRSDLRREFLVVAKPLASGASASVHEARALDDRLDGFAAERRLAAKVFPAKGSLERRVVRVKAEVASLLLVQGHPNIIRFRGLFACEGEEQQEGLAEGEAVDPLCKPGHVVLTDLCPRGDLHTCVSRRGVCTEAEALKLVQQVFSALAHCHSRGVVHRDVKSENILIADDGRPILTDFGVAARLTGEEVMREKCGTPGHMAPEVLDGSRYGKKVDTFSTGVVLYFAMLGRTPFVAPGRKKNLEAVTRNTLECCVGFPPGSAVSDHVKGFILILLTKDPEDRPSARCARELIRVLRLVPAGLAGEAPGGGCPAAGSEREAAPVPLREVEGGGDDYWELSQPSRGEPCIRDVAPVLRMALAAPAGVAPSGGSSAAGSEREAALVPVQEVEEGGDDYWGLYQPSRGEPWARDRARVLRAVPAEPAAEVPGRCDSAAGSEREAALVPVQEDARSDNYWELGESSRGEPSPPEAVLQPDEAGTAAKPRRQPGFFSFQRLWDWGRRDAMKASPPAGKTSDGSRSSADGDAGGQRQPGLFASRKVHGAAWEPDAGLASGPVRTHEASCSSSSADVHPQRAGSFSLSSTRRVGTAHKAKERHVAWEADTAADTTHVSNISRYSVGGSDSSSGWRPAGQPRGFAAAPEAGAGPSAEAAVAAEPSNGSAGSEPGGAASGRSPRRKGSRHGPRDLLVPSRGEAGSSFDAILVSEGGSFSL